MSLGLLVNAENVYFVLLPAAAVYLYCRRRDVRALAIGFGWAAAGLAPGAIAFAVYNYVRWGSVTSSGYEAITVGFWTHNVLWGLWGQLFAPGKSIFLFSPVLVLALFGVRRLIARRPNAAFVIAVTVFPLLLLYSRYQFWSGDWGWGPRYLVFALPALMLPAAELFSDPLSRAWRIGAMTVFVVAVGVQTIGNFMTWDPFIDVARQVQRQWLGRPDTRGTVLSPYPCSSCLEEVYGIQWLPPLQPIAGQWWLARHKLAGDDWRTAEADAPWKRYTSLTLNIEQSYDSAAIDHWSAQLPPGSKLPTLAIIALLLGIATPVRKWRNALSAESPPGSSSAGSPGPGRPRRCLRCRGCGTRG